MRGGRARWKIENETFNTLKNQGDNFAHNYGHGADNLSVVFAMLMMLAFLVDQTQQLGGALFQAVWTKLGSKRRLWERMRALFYDDAFASMRQLCEALLYGFKKSSPLVAVDSSSSSPCSLRPRAIEPNVLPSLRKLRLNEEMGLLSTRQPVMPNRESLCQRWGNGWSQHSLRCPLHSRLGFTRPQRELLDKK